MKIRRSSLPRLAVGLCLAFLTVPCARLLADDPNSRVLNGGFEEGHGSWTDFVPTDSAQKGCKTEVVQDHPHGGHSCMKMSDDDVARFCIGSKEQSVVPKERYRVVTWVRSEPGTQIKPGEAGFLIRLSLRKEGKDAAGGHILIDTDSRVFRGTAVPSAAGRNDLPGDWKKIEAVVEIPDGVDAMGVNLFVWNAKGAVFVDDVSVVKVPASTPLSAALSSGPGNGLHFTDTELMAQFDPATPGLEAVVRDARAGDLAATQRDYLQFRRTASKARFFINPVDQPAQPTEKDDAIGDELLVHHIRNAYGFSPKAGDMGKDFNWKFNPVAHSDPAYTDEWTYCAVSRTQFWKGLGDAYWKTRNDKYAAEWVAQMQDFVAKNPVGEGTGSGPALWRTLDSAIRMLDSWPNAYYHCLHSPALTPAANWNYARSVSEHARFLKSNLVDLKRNGNWVMTECCGLYTVGVLFPEIKESAEWRKAAVDRLTFELGRVAPPDGFETELTPNYHMVALDGFRGPVRLAKLNDLTLPDGFRDKMLSMYRALVLMMDADGNVTPTNDSGVHNARKIAEQAAALGHDDLLEWATSNGERGKAPPLSTALPYAGFYAMRGGWKKDDFFLFFRAGPTGTGHQHEDMLEVALHANGKTLLIDPGSYDYDQSEWRRYFITTPSHNTIIVDGKGQHRGNSPTPVLKPTGNPWVTTPAFDYAAGTYDAGYEANTYVPREYTPLNWEGKPDTSVAHTRRVLYLRPDYALLLDTLDGSGEHTFDAHFHLNAPAVKVDSNNGSAVSEGDDARVGLFPLEHDNLTTEVVTGQTNPTLGWKVVDHHAVPTPTVRFRKKQAAPATFATLLYPFKVRLRRSGKARWPRPATACGRTRWKPLRKRSKSSWQRMA